MIRKCEVCGTYFEASRERDICDECARAVEHRIYHPTHGVCCICGAVMPGARRGKKYCSNDCRRIGRKIIVLRWTRTHMGCKKKKAPEAPKPEKPKGKKSFLSEVEDLGRKMGYGGYGQMMAVIRARCQHSGLSVKSEFCHLKFDYEKEHCHD